MHRVLERHEPSVVSGNGTGPLELLVQQLWLPAVQSGRARVVVNPQDSAEWSDAEQYWVLPTIATARLLAPVGPRPATSGALARYRLLRTPLRRQGRLAAATAARAGVPLGRDRLTVQVRGDAGVAALPLRMIADALQRPRLYAAIGIRTGANRKATLQLVDERGTPAGYAKLAWSSATRRLVECETEALRRVGGRDGPARAPALLAAGRTGDRPYLVTQPLPLSARSPGPDDPIPTPQELAALCPVHRRCTVSATGQFVALSRRIAALPPSSTGGDLAAAMHGLTERLASSRREVPVTERWHGDLVPWNTARDAEDRLWCWDWESSEEDAVAGLDAVHWAMSRERRRTAGIGADSLDRSVESCRVQLWAAGLPRSDWALTAAVYALTTAERACSLAYESGWAAVWIDERRLTTLLTSAASMLGRDRR